MGNSKLPCYRPFMEPPLSAKTPNAKEGLSSKRILIVDDHDDYREALRQLLTARGYAVDTAVDGFEGMKLALLMRPDLILTDFSMPRRNGFELLRELRAHAETLKLPVVLFTGAAGQRQLRGLPDDRFKLLEKPLSNEVLLAAIETYIGKSGGPLAAAAPAAAPLPQNFEWAQHVSAVNELLVEVAPSKDVEEESRLDDAADSPLVEQINRLMIRAFELGASDIHFDPQQRELAVRMRVDGRLCRVGGFPAALKQRLVARIKIMASLVITERRRPQDGQIRAEFKGQRLDFRVSTMPAQYGEKVVMRLLGTAGVRQRIADLGLCQHDRDNVDWALNSAHGLVLATGPTGSGKSTTLYTMINVLNRPGVNIMTAEDPVEREIPGVTQVAARPGIGMTFDVILRGFLRQDPDIVLVGEIRDLETADMAMKASITGHLILSTVHTNGAPSVIARLVSMGVAPYLIASSLRLVVAQRLVRMLCVSCRKRAASSERDLQLLSEHERRRLAHTFSAAGCADCAGTGFKGREALFEIMPMRTARMRATILASEGTAAISAVACDEGMRTLHDAAVDAVAAGYTSLTEALPIIVAD